MGSPSPVLDPAAPTRAAGLRIPRVFHRIWLGGSQMPAELEAFGRSWLEHHPGWRMVTWTEQTLPALCNQALFDAAPTLAQKADLARYEVLAREGGVYLDTDFECLRNLEPLLDGVEAFSAREDEGSVAIGLMGAVPGHPLFRTVVEAVPAGIASGALSAAEQTGPGLLTAVLARGGVGEVTVFAPELFYPYHYTEPERRGERFPGAYAVHHWMGSWKREERDVFRYAVAIDVGEPAVALTALSSFARTFRAGDPAELALVLADPAEAEAVVALVQLTCPDLSGAADVVAYAPAEVLPLPLEAAVALGEPPAVTARALSAMLEHMGSVRGHLDEHCAEPKCVSTPGVRHVDRTALLRRPPAPPAPAVPALSGPAAPGVWGTYVGDGRVLCRTRWGGKLLCAARDLSITTELVADGDYEPWFTAYLQSRLRPGMRAIDVGANVGLFTVLMARCVGPTGRVVAYEASPEVGELLRENVALNWIGDVVDVRARAAADRSGTLGFHAPARFLGNGSLVSPCAADGRTTAIEVEAEPLDALGLDHVDFVKIDVEGAELLVLRGMRDLLARRAVGTVAFELLRERMGDDWDGMCGLLRGLRDSGWRFRLLDGEGVPYDADLERILAHGSFSQVLVEPR